MRRIRITLIESKKGWKARREAWDTEVNHGFYGGKTIATLTHLYASPSDALEALACSQDAEDRETGHK